MGLLLGNWENEIPARPELPEAGKKEKRVNSWGLQASQEKRDEFLEDASGFPGFLGLNGLKWDGAAPKDPCMLVEHRVA